MKYTVVEEPSKGGLVFAVNEMLKEGWKLQGGVAIAVDQGRHTYMQAMIKV